MCINIESSKTNKDKAYVPYSEWSEKIIKQINELVDECLDRFKDDKKLNTEILKLLSKLQNTVKKKYSSN